MRTRFSLFIVYLALASVGVFVMVSARSFESRTYPTVLGAILSCCAVIQIVRLLCGGGNFAKEGAHKPFTIPRPVWLTMLASVLYILLLEPLGFIVASLLFMGCLMWMHGYRYPLRITLISLTTVFGLFLFFSRVVHINLPLGILPF